MGSRPDAEPSAAYRDSACALCSRCSASSPSTCRSFLLTCSGCVIERLLPEVAGALAAGGHTLVTDVGERRDIRAADVLGPGAAGVEGAAGRDVHQVRRQALDRVE